MDLSLIKEQIIKELGESNPRQIVDTNNSYFSEKSFAIDKKRNVLFLKMVFVKNDFMQLLDEIKKLSSKNHWQSFIIIGETNDNFENKELTWFDGDKTFVRFYLINTETSRHYCDMSWSSLDIYSRKYLKKIRKIVN